MTLGLAFVVSPVLLAWLLLLLILMLSLTQFGYIWVVFPSHLLMLLFGLRSLFYIYVIFSFGFA